MATTDTDKRTRAESIVETILATTQSGMGSPDGADHAEAVADRLDVPVGLVWLAVDGVTVEQIDELCVWWPQKGGA
jgi:hypothetical protein